ncbi:MAG: zinc-binding dehydrogenase [Acidimicrobiales bacterium]|jgi:threonine dehydrogenase-like Zn-dependent dehydrogenase
MKALVFERNLARFAASRVASSLVGSGKGISIGPLRLTELEAPALPGPGWHRVRPRLAGICGSDLATLDGRSSRYFEDLVSFPFVPGHEIVGTVKESFAGNGATTRTALPPGTRVVVESVIGCIPRGIDPPCPACATGRIGGCERVAFGHISPGLQIGYCTDTGGGWSTAGLVAHETQLHAVPDELSDEDAVMVEPTACAVHAATRAEVNPGDTVAVLGAGTLGLTTVAALRSLTEPGAIFVGAKHTHQRRLAEELGADAALPPAQLGRAVRRQSRSLAVSEHSHQLTGGADVVVDCVGNPESLTEALSIVRPRGRVVLGGMPGNVRVDLASLWHREVTLTSAYAYGTEEVSGSSRRTFDLAMEMVASCRLGRLVSARYPLDRFEEAVAHAGTAGRRGAVKVVFDLGPERGASSAERTARATRTAHDVPTATTSHDAGTSHDAQSGSTP